MRRYVKARFVAHWHSMPGAFHDEPTIEAAIAFAQEQARFNSSGSCWSVTDEVTGALMAHGITP